MRCFLILVLTCTGCLGQTLSPEQRQRNIASFEKVWTTVRDRHWAPAQIRARWNAIHDQLRPKMEQAASMDEARGILREMLDSLHLTHYAVYPGEVAMAVSDEADDGGGDGSPGFDFRVISGNAVVTRGTPGAPMGWQIRAIQNKPLAPLIARVSAGFNGSSLLALTLHHAIERLLDGPPGVPVRVEFEDGEGRTHTLSLPRRTLPGRTSQFGNLPPMHVWIEARRVRDVGVVAFNVFLDPQRLMTEFQKAVRDCADCRGFVIDLRGNPGGIGIMAMGMAGFFVTQPDLKLGTMLMRDLPLKFVINPRQPSFAGPLAILVDGLSASTSEILAGGLQDLHRARIFGTPTAGAALPSMIERLPNGDGFQYAVADYRSESGRELEGAGVTPDVIVPYDRQRLLRGEDAALDAALEWIRSQGETK